MGKKILLADDSLTIQKVVELTLSGTDYELTCVSNGQKALERLGHSRPDLILADVVMPEKNGYEVCEAVKSNPATAKIPLVLLSGTFEPFDRERAERIGCDLVVSKPFDAQQLLEDIETLLERSGAGSGSAPVQEEEPFATASLEETLPTPGDAAGADAEGPFSPAFGPMELPPQEGAWAMAPAPEPELPDTAPLEAISSDTVPPVEEPLPPIPQPLASGAPPPPDSLAAAPVELPIEEISAEEAEILFDRSQAPEQAVPPSPLPPLAELTEEQIERIAARGVAKLSDRVVREIAWEVVPDAAEIAVRRRIEELESGAE